MNFICLCSIYKNSTNSLLILYLSSTCFHHTQQILSPLQTYSLQLLNVLFRTRKCILYSPQTYTSLKQNELIHLTR